MWKPAGGVCLALCNAALMGVLVHVTGCAVNEEYPDDWVALEQSTEGRVGACPDISGIYMDQAVSYDGAAYRYNLNSLATYLFIPLAGDVRKASASSPDSSDSSFWVGRRLEIEQPSEGIILVRPSTGEKFELSAEDGHFTCEEGAIDLGSWSEFSGDGTAIGFIGFGYSLFKTEDQSLILLERSSGVGLFTIIPFAMSSKDWVARWVLEENYKFPPDYGHHTIVRARPEISDLEMMNIRNTIELPNDEAIYAAKTRISEQSNNLRYGCYSDVLALTDTHIFALWNVFAVSTTCPQSGTEDSFRRWEYDKLESAQPLKASGAFKINLIEDEVTNGSMVEVHETSLNILFISGKDMAQVQNLINERLNPD